MHLTPSGSSGAATVEDCGRTLCWECVNVEKDVGEMEHESAFSGF